VTAVNEIKKFLRFFNFSNFGSPYREKFNPNLTPFAAAYNRHFNVVGKFANCACFDFNSSHFAKYCSLAESTYTKTQILALKSISRYLTDTFDFLLLSLHECRCLRHGTQASSQNTQARDTRVAVPHQQTLSTFLFLSFAFYGMMTVAGSGHSSREL